MSLLSLVQDFCEEQNLPAPSGVMSSADSQVKQVRAILKREGADLAKRGNWEALTREATHTTLAAEDQGTIISIATNGFRSIINDTLWDRTDKLPVPLIGSVAWQGVKALSSISPRYRYRLRGGKLLLTPTPPAGHTLAFEYLSQNWILGADGTTYKQAVTLDTDTFLLPEELLVLGLNWRWLKHKGLDYAEDFAAYEYQVMDALGRDGGKEVLSMNDIQRELQPGIWVSPTSWSL